MSAAKVKINAFASASDALSGVDALFAGDGPQQIVVPIHLIDVKGQVRELFETEDSTIKELSESIRRQGVLQPILLRPLADRYELVAGERRLRASKLAGLTELPAYVRELDDTEVADAQFAENIHRLNLTQMEEAKKLKRDLDSLGGDYTALSAKHSKSKSWVSKRLALLNLPPETQRIVDHRLSGDIELISTVRQIEKANPAKAREVVDELKASRGKNAREIVAKVKEAVKPAKKAVGSGGGVVATARDRSFEVPSPVNVFSGEKRLAATMLPAEHVAKAMAFVYTDLYDKSLSANKALAAMSGSDAEDVYVWLSTFWHMGLDTTQAATDVMRGFREGHFATDGVQAFQLTAFLLGASRFRHPRDEVEFDLLTVFAALQA